MTNYHECLKRRNLISEIKLNDILIKINVDKRFMLDSTLQKEYSQIDEDEEKELQKMPLIAYELLPRTSGAKEWREARNES